MNDISRILQEESDAIESNPNAPITNSKVTRKNASPSDKMRIYSIRLTGKDVEALEDKANQAGLPPSALARSWIVEKLAEDQEEINISNVVHVLENAVHTLSMLDKKQSA